MYAQTLWTTKLLQNNGCSPRPSWRCECGFVAGRRGAGQVDEAGAFNRKDYVGLAVYVDLADGTQKCRFVNACGDVVSVYNPFAEGPAQKEFVLDLK